MWLYLRRFPPLEFSWFTPNTNTRRWNLWLNPRPYFLERELIYLVVWQLSIKVGWWNTPLALRNFRRSNKHENSLKESPWFSAFPPPFPAFPPWFIRIPHIPCIPTLARFPAFPPWFSAFPSFSSFRSPILHSGFYR